MHAHSETCRHACVHIARQYARAHEHSACRRLHAPMLTERAIVCVYARAHVCVLVLMCMCAPGPRRMDGAAYLRHLGQSRQRQLGPSQLQMPQPKAPRSRALQPGGVRPGVMPRAGARGAGRNPLDFLRRVALRDKPANTDPLFKLRRRFHRVSSSWIVAERMIPDNVRTLS